MATPKHPTTSGTRRNDTQPKVTSPRPLAAWESNTRSSKPSYPNTEAGDEISTCEVCMKKTNGKRYCRDCEQTHDPKIPKSSLHPIVRDWNKLTGEQKSSLMKTPEWTSRLSPQAKSQMWREMVLGAISALALVGFSLAFVAIINSYPPTTTVEQPTAQTAKPVQTPKLPVLIAGTQDDLWTYLNDNFQGTDWFIWVDSTNYYVDGSVRVMDVNLNGFVSTDREAAKQIAQTACIAVYQFWIAQERNGTRAFEVLFVGDTSGNVYRREDYAGGENCLVD
jgi:hypothetical protein